jgi:hypothetical protein
MTATFLSALAAVQAEAPTLPKDKTNPHFHSKFTGLDTIVETVGPILSKHGLVWITKPGQGDNGPTLEYRLVHVETGEGETGTMPLLLTKADSQGLGSALTYARRYALCSVLNLVSDDDDDGNGNAAANTPSRSASAGRTSSGVTASKPQQTKIKGLVTSKGAKAPQLRMLLDRVGASNVQVKDGWVATLSVRQASELIDALTEPLPDVGNPSDVPGSADGEFQHPPASLEGTPLEAV